MSKQSEAKKRQGYVEKVITTVCGNCKNYESKVTVLNDSFGNVYHKESEKRCGIGGFTVKKMGYCNEHIIQAHSEELTGPSG